MMHQIIIIKSIILNFYQIRGFWASILKHLYSIETKLYCKKYIRKNSRPLTMVIKCFYEVVFMEIKSTLTDLSKTQRKLFIEVPTESVQEVFNSCCQNLQKNTSVKGFRKGKVPIAMLKQTHSSQLQKSVLDSLIYKFLNQALKIHNQKVLQEQPEITIEQFSENAPFKFTAKFESYPTIDTVKTDNLRISKQKFGHESVTKKTNYIIEKYREPFSTLTSFEKDHKAQIGNTVIINCKGFFNDKLIGVLEDLIFDIEDTNKEESQKTWRLKATPLTLEKITVSFLYQERILKSFVKEAFSMDMKIGDQRKVLVRDSDNKVSQSNVLTLQVNLKDICQKTLLPLDDQFAKRLKFSSMKEMREQIMNQCMDEEHKYIENQLQENVLRELVITNPLDVPKKFIQEIKLELIKDSKTRMSKADMNPQTIESEIATLNRIGFFEKEAQYLITKDLLIDHLAEKWNLLKPIKEKLQKIIKDQPHHKHQENTHSLLMNLLKNAIAEQLISRANVTEVKRSTDLVDLIW